MLRDFRIAGRRLLRDRWSTAAAVLVAALGAGLSLPARQAARANPLDALRHDQDQPVHTAPLPGVGVVT